MTIAINSASFGAQKVTGNGTSSGAVECRVRVEAGGAPTYKPPGMWVAVNPVGGNWSVEIDVGPATPTPAYVLEVRLQSDSNGRPPRERPAN